MTLHVNKYDLEGGVQVPRAKFSSSQKIFDSHFISAKTWMNSEKAMELLLRKILV